MKKLFFLFALLVCSIAFSQVKELSITNWKFRKVGDKEWMKASVPGTVHTDLFANKKIQDPFSPGADTALKWIEECDWEYETELLLSDLYYGRQNYELVFEGLDTYAKVYLNDSLILDADNMFRTWRVDVKQLIKFPANKIKVVLASAVKKGKELAKTLPYKLPEGERVFTRKAQYQYGWDFAPRFVTCGIWKPVKLAMWNDARLGHVRFSVDSLKESRARINFNVDVRCGTDGDYQVLVTSPQIKEQSSEFNTPIEPGPDNFYDVPFIIRNPKLWWCNGLGDPFLYEFKVQLYKGKKLVDQRILYIGIRTISLEQQKDAMGESFHFKVNGVPVFMKGANLVPPDIFLPRVKKETYGRIVQSAVDANMNMLRVWGGGVYADDEFLNLCDQKGVLVWEDFMYACAMYPNAPFFLPSAADESIEQEGRMNHHASLALWCGNNECDEGWNNWGWQKQYKYSQEDSLEIIGNYKFLFEYVFPQHFINSLANIHTPYIPTSPKYGWGRPESMLSGDSHYWGVWWGMEPFEIYNKKVGRFMSEFGFQGFPSLSTLKKNCGDSVSLNSSCLKNYQKHPKGFETINEYMQRDFKVPAKFEHYVYVSQLLQARGMEIAISAHRRNKPYCMGSLYWQLNDCWPGISWSSIDFDGNWKAAHYAAKKCFGDLLISITEENDSVKVFVVSDLLQKKEAVLQWQLIDFKGKVLWKGSKPIRIEANSSKVFFSFPISEMKNFNKNEVVLACSLQDQDIKEAVSVYHYFAAPKDLLLSKPKISVRYIGKDKIEVSSDVLAKNVFLQSTDTLFFEDNFFDLLPGEIRTVKVTGHGRKKPSIRTMSLADTF